MTIAERTAAGTGSRALPETILGDILKGSFDAMVREMAVLIERTAMSPIIREKQDYAVGLFDTEGRMVFAEFLMQGPGMIDPILKRFPVETMRPGDVYCYNDPYLSDGASGHVPDITFCLPVFQDGKVRALVALFGHFWDLGGYSPGGLSPFVTEVFHEGILIPPVRLVCEGEYVDDVYALLLRNTRFPGFLDGDVRACISACSLGVRRVEELFDRYGVERVLAGCERALRQSGDWGRRILDQLLPDGSYVGEDLVDGDGFTDAPFKVQLRIEKQGGKVRFDFSGTDAQAKGPINFLQHPGILKTVLLGRILQAYEPRLTLNDGVDGIVDEVEIPDGSLLWPKFPAGVALRALSRILV
ncbi:MAG: hydantoinase B/oxoprolinase family protein [Alphaproteobacteria bacterium]|jgi:N-methylhydantoinase B|nr:hydantoinase B/oxoprolinase family protein [Alphaproteobacteria bacterium]